MISCPDKPTPKIIQILVATENYQLTFRVMAGTVTELTGWHDGDFGCYHTLQTQVTQRSSHHTARKSEVLN